MDPWRTRKAKEIDAELRREQAKVEEARQKIAARSLATKLGTVPCSDLRGFPSPSHDGKEGSPDSPLHVGTNGSRIERSLRAQGLLALASSFLETTNHANLSTKDSLVIWQRCRYVRISRFAGNFKTATHSLSAESLSEQLWTAGYVMILMHHYALVVDHGRTRHRESSRV